MTLAIIVHGGAKTVSEDKEQSNHAGCLAAVEVGWMVLQSGGSAREAVEVAIRQLEANPTFNAGVGRTLDQAGQVGLDAAMMEGNTLRWGAVAAIQRVLHPICTTNKLLDEKRLLLVGTGAEQLAESHSCEMCEPSQLTTQEQYQEWQEEALVLDRPATVDCVALDAHPGGSLKAQVDGEAGCILVNPQGEIGWVHYSSPMPIAYITDQITRPIFYLEKPSKLPA